MKQSSEQYAKNGGNECPQCESSSIDIDETEIGEAGSLNQAMYCNECEATWVEKYKLIGYDDLEISEEEQSDEETEKEETEDEPEEDQEES